MSLLRLRCGRPSGPIEINFGAKTLQGFGGYPTSEAAGSSYTGTWGAYFTTDNAGNMVPAASGSFTYRSTWTPPASSGSSTIVGASGQQYIITILPNAAHVRQRTSYADFPDSTSGFANWELGWVIGYPEIGVAATTVTLGCTVWCRDGFFNPTGLRYFLSPWPATRYTGSGRITIRSETVDTTVDAWGYPNRRHGFKMGGFNLSPNSGGGSQALDFVDLMWFANVTPSPSLPSFIDCNAGSTWDSINFTNCGFECDPVLTTPPIGGVKSLQDTVTFDNNTLKRLNGGISTKTGQTGLHAHNNVCMGTRDGDFVGMALNTDNFNIQFNIVFDSAPATDVHCDGVQHFGLTVNAAGGIISNNIFYKIDGQGIFLADTFPNAVKFTNLEIKNNLISVEDGHALYAQDFTDYALAFNTVLNRQGAPSGAIVGMGAGVNANPNKNVANGFNYADPTALSGTNTRTPNPQITVTQTTAAYLAIFPGYVDASLASDFSEAALKSYFTPSSAGFTTLASSGALNAAGAWNA